MAASPVDDAIYQLDPEEQELFESSTLEDDYELGGIIGKYV